MNQRRAKALRRRSYELAAAHLITLLPPEESLRVDGASVKEFEKKQEKYVFDGGSALLAPYSSRWFYQRLKGRKDFMLQSFKELGV